MFNNTPRMPLYLTLGGILPFAASAILYVLSSSPIFPLYSETLSRIAAVSIIAYGAVILSFLGGARWGTELTRNGDAPNDKTLIYAVLPSIAGWAAVLLMSFGTVVSAALLFIGFALVRRWDMMAINEGFYPDWYLALRNVGTFGALFSLLAVWLVSAIL